MTQSMICLHGDNQIAEAMDKMKRREEIEILGGKFLIVSVRYSRFDERNQPGKAEVILCQVHPVAISGKVSAVPAKG